MKKKWIIKSDYDPKQDVVDQILKNRGIQDTFEFLNIPTLNSYVQKLPQDLIENLKKAKELIFDAIHKKKTILIYGDYDADGICATTILYKTLKNELKHEKTQYFIPNRFDHGYGLSKKAIDLISAEVNEPNILFITVDTGITAVDEVDYLKSLGHQIIITDHHQKSVNLPKSDVTVWYDQIVGASVSWLLSKALGSKNLVNVCYAAIATVTDLQPVLNFNRAIVKTGLEVLNKSTPVGINALLQMSGKQHDEISTYELGWIIGPRLNASGRLQEADISFKLLIEENKEQAQELALKVNQMNVDRQDKTLEMYNIASVDEKELPLIIFSSSDEYHEGVIGLVASQLMQKFYRPTVVISLSEKYGKGSVRSIPGVNIIEILRHFEDMFISLGGHPMAAGFTIDKEKISDLEEKLLNYAEDVIKPGLLVPFIEIDLKLPLSNVNTKLLNEVESMKPFGIGNSEPLFVSEQVGISGVNRVGRDSKHLSLSLYDGALTHKGIWFNAPEDLKLGDRVDVAYTLKRNNYNGKTSVDLFIKDIR